MKIFNLAFFSIFAVIIFLLTFREGGFHLVGDGLIAGGKMLVKLLPILLIAFLIVGQAQVLMERHLDEIKTRLSGEKGVLVALVSGALTPSVIAFYPMLKTMWDQRVGRRAVIMFLLAFVLLNWQILIFRVPLLGWTPTLFTFLAAFFLSLIAAGLLWAAERLFG